MGRKANTPKMQTATMSVCVTLDEAQLIRDAATTQGLTVSAWAVSRSIMAMASAGNRAKVASAAKRIEQAQTPRGARSSRVSMVMRQSDHEDLKEAAAALNITAHAFAQAVLLETAAEELKDMPGPERRAIETRRRAVQAAGTMLISVPVAIDGLSVTDVSELVRKLIVGASKGTLAGDGPKIAAGATRLAASRADEPHHTIKLVVPEFDMRAVAFVLEIPPATLATALTLKAAKALTGEA